MPFVFDGQRGGVEIVARGVRHRIAFGLDALRQQPVLDHAQEAAPDVRTGTAVRVSWPRSASSILREAEVEFLQVVSLYPFLNPHLTLAVEWFDEARLSTEAVAPGWRKWTPAAPTSPHWYTPERLSRLIAATIAHDEEGEDRDGPRMVREFISQFRGLTGTAKQKRVLDATGLHRAPLRSLVGADGLDEAAVARLLAAMREESRLVPPAALGAIGEAALRARFEALGVHPQTFDYKHPSVVTSDGRPAVVEAAFGWAPKLERRWVAAGVNWSPGLGSPFRDLGGAGSAMGLESLLTEQRTRYKGVFTLVHLAMPGVAYTDRGKTAVALPGEVGGAIESAVTAVTKRWARQRKAEERDRTAELRRMAVLARERSVRVTIKEAAYRVMVTANRRSRAGRSGRERHRRSARGRRHRAEADWR